MAKIVSSYIAVLLLVSLGFLGIGTFASADELRSPLQAPALVAEKLRPAR